MLPRGKDNKMKPKMQSNTRYIEYEIDEDGTGKKKLEKFIVIGNTFFRIFEKEESFPIINSTTKEKGPRTFLFQKADVDKNEDNINSI